MTPTKPGEPDRLMTQAEVAAYLRVTPKTVSRLRDAGKLPYLPGRPVRIWWSDVERYLRAKLVRKPPPPLSLPLVLRSKKDLTARQRARAMAAQLPASTRALFAATLDSRTKPRSGR